MATWLKQIPSSTLTVLIGPIVDSVDATAELGQNITQTDVLLWKQGGAGLSAKNESTTCTHRSNGMYTCILDSTDLNTLGQLTINVAKAGTMVYARDFMVVPVNVWDAMFGADKLWVDAVELNNVAASAAQLERSASVILTGTSDNTGFTASSTIMETSSITEATADHYKGRVIVFTSGALLGQATSITAYALSSGRGRFTYSALTEAVPNGTTFVIV